MVEAYVMRGGLREKKHAINRKYGEREIDLAVDGWRHSTNCEDKPKTIESACGFAASGFISSSDLDIHLEGTAYNQSATQVLKGFKAVYIKGEGIKPTVPGEVIKEAKQYLSLKNKNIQKVFLMAVYNNIIKCDPHKVGRIDLSYSGRFIKKEGEITAILNYFADKMRSIGLEIDAQRLEVKIREQFPKEPDQLEGLSEFLSKFSSQI